MKKVVLVVEVDARDDQSPEEVSKLLDAVINAGLSDAQASLELDEEDRMGNPEEILDLNIHSPVLLSSLIDPDENVEEDRRLLEEKDRRLLLEKQPWIDIERLTGGKAPADTIDPNKEENTSYWGRYGENLK